MLDSILARPPPPPSSPSNNHPSSPIKRKVESKTVLCFQENESKAAAAVTANCNGNGQANQVYRNDIEDQQYDENEDDQVDDDDDQLNACATKDADDDDGDDDGARTMLHDHDHCGELMVDVVDKPCSPHPPDDDVDDNDTTSSSTNNDNNGRTIETATTMDPSRMNGNMNPKPSSLPPPPQPPQPSESSDHPGPMVPVNGGHHHSCLQRIKSQHLHYNNHNHHQQPEQDLNRKPSSKFTAFRRTRSLNAPSPICQFGPCGSIKKNPTMVMTIQDPASQRLTWHKPPSTVLIIKKIHDALVIQPFLDLVQFLIWDKHMTVFVEASVLDDVHLKNNPLFEPLRFKVKTFRDGKDDLTDKVDFIICLGGDGTLLYASSLFQESVPPVMAFHMGSLGFLTPFRFENFQQKITNVLKGNTALTLRSRLRCMVVRCNESGAPLDQTIEDGGARLTANVHNDSCHLVLNEMVVDRGPSPYLSNVDLYIDGKLVTTVQGDGLIVSTPTGSTAYAVAAGASMIHPSVPAIMVTPICPHSLSFRPIVMPAGVELKICVSPDSRNSAWVSFDGRNRQEIQVGDSVRVTTSIYPVPSICEEDQISDWFESLAECLHWNLRQKQKQFDEFSDLIHSSSNDSLNK